MIDIILSWLGTLCLCAVGLFFGVRFAKLERAVKELDDDIGEALNNCEDSVRIVYINQCLQARDNCVREENYELAAKFDKIVKQEIGKLKKKVKIDD